MSSQRELVQRELEKVVYADLSDYDAAAQAYHIPRTRALAVKENRCYLVRVKESAAHNEILRVNYNGGRIPEAEYYLVDVEARLGKIIKVTAVEYDAAADTPTAVRWQGYLALKDIEVVREV